MGTVAAIRPSTHLTEQGVDSAPVTFEVLATDDLDRLIPEWDACASAGADNPFTLTPGFAATVSLEVARRSELCLVTGRDAVGTLQAILPLSMPRARVPLFGLRTLVPLALHSQETSAILVGRADPAAAMVGMVDHLMARTPLQWDVLHFETINPGSALFGALLEGASRHGLTVLTSPPVPNPVLTPTRESTARLPGLTSRFRRNIRRAARVARESGRKVTCREMSWEWRQHAEAIAALYLERWGDGSPAGSFAVHDAGCQGVLDLLFTRLDRYFRAHVFGAFVDDELAAYVICFRGGREVVLWNSCLAERHRGLSVGMLLWDHCLHEIATWRGVERINFGKGGDRFKVDWSDASYAVCELAIVRASGLRGRLAVAKYARRFKADGASQ